MKTTHSFLLAVAFCITLALAPQARAAASIQESVTSGNPTNAWTGVSGGTSLYSVGIYNASTTVNFYAWVFDSSTNQLDGTRQCVAFFQVPTNGVVWFSPPGGERVTKGVTIMQSLTPVALTNSIPAASQFIIWVKHNRG